jgi:hypothetical protein
MDIRKYEKLINLVINEDKTAADALFHEIVVEKSREIFESIMAEEDMEEGMGGQVGDMLDEINAEESGVMEDEDEADIDFDDEAEDDGEDFTHDFEQDHDEDEGEAHEEIEDAVIRIEDKLDQLMAEFEEIMGGDEGEEDFGGEGEEDYGDEGDFGSEDEMDEDMMMENITLHKVPVTHGDNGSNTKNPVAFNSGQAGMDSRPVKFSGSAETVPTSPKKPSDYLTKGEGNLPGAGNFKNVPGKNNFKDKGDAAPKPKHGDDGSNFRSPVAESRRPARRPSR